MHEEELLTSKNSFNRLQCIILKFIIFINLGFESYIILSLNYIHPRPEKFPPPYLCGPNYVFIEKNWSANRLADRFHCAGFGLRQMLDQIWPLKIGLPISKQIYLRVHYKKHILYDYKFVVPLINQKRIFIGIPIIVVPSIFYKQGLL